MTFNLLFQAASKLSFLDLRVGVFAVIGYLFTAQFLLFLRHLVKADWGKLSLETVRKFMPVSTADFYPEGIDGTRRSDRDCTPSPAVGGAVSGLQNSEGL
jgi:hypothetical protein